MDFPGLNPKTIKNERRKGLKVQRHYGVVSKLHYHNLYVLFLSFFFFVQEGRVQVKKPVGFVCLRPP